VPVTIALRFPWGRVHATPWERSANEAEPEWPLSTWRLLRALYSVWRFRCPEIDGGAVERVLGALVAPPSYRLPPHTTAHTRHYFPDATHRSGQSGATDKVFDAFIVIPTDEAVQLHWASVDLDPEATDVLARLLAELPFLGRAESLCEASIIDAPGDGDWIAPLATEEGSMDRRRPVSVLTPAAPLDLPRLLATTRQVRAARFTDPPGSRRVPYPMPVRHEARESPRRPATPRPTIVVLGVQANAPPSVTASLVMCELLRLCLQSKFGRLTGGAVSPTLSGKRHDGERRLDQHSHAHYLALPSASNARFIGRFVIWAPEGLGPEEVRAITMLRELKPGARAIADGGKELREVRVRLEAIGGPELLGAGLAARASVWRSVTPFITGRNMGDSTRRRLKDATDPWLGFLAAEVQREAELRGLQPVRVVPRLRREDGSSWLAFRRHRAFKSERLASAPRGCGFDLEFSEPVSGPIALGAQSHFGLGLFLPVVERR